MKKLNIFILFLLAFSLNIIGQPTINRIFQWDKPLGLYEKLEISLRIDADYENPFDPDEIDIMGIFISPSGEEWKVPGFYSQAYRGGFSIRFSANETGEWSYNMAR